ncbi:MAG: exodeoxyribonuclease VII small subunit [Eubacteriales bacterium]|nr:exodeoxyribonuclease VII small subunit [Eubacteriales bacterium]
MAVKKKESSFEEQLAALEQLADRMETGDLPLDELLTAYEQGMKLSAELKKRLEGAKARMLEVKEQKDGVTLAPVQRQATLLDGLEGAEHDGDL